MGKEHTCCRMQIEALVAVCLLFRCTSTLFHAAEPAGWFQHARGGMQAFVEPMSELMIATYACLCVASAILGKS